MNIEGVAATGANSRFWQKVEAEQGLQSLFAQVLADAGRQGYASAELPGDLAATAETADDETTEAETATATAAPNLDEQITDGWNQWLAVTGRTRYRDVENAQQVLDDYNNLLRDAREAGAYAAPQAYLKSLSKEQLATLQQVNRLADPIQPGKLTEEGAINLLLPPPAQIDLNHDGLTQSGKAYGIRFPDSRTPPEVVDAWNESTADLSPMDRMMREFHMVADVLLANIHVDSEGRFVRAVEPGDPEFVNPHAAADFSYVQKAEQAIESIEYFKAQTPSDKYERDMAFWSSFRDALVEHGAA